MSASKTYILDDQWTDKDALDFTPYVETLAPSCLREAYPQGTPKSDMKNLLPTKILLSDLGEVPVGRWG